MTKIQAMTRLVVKSIMSLDTASTEHRILVGTSGFGYAEWKGAFYPENLPTKKFLSYYAQHFKTTEINNTFYRIPSAKVTEGWYAEVPADFSFTVKLSQKITHIKRLKNVDQEMTWFFNGIAPLKEKLGPILVQLPPNYKKDISVLSDFLEKFSSAAKLALEFRHESWFEDAVYEVLKKNACSLGIVEKEEAEGATPREVTGPFIYMRLRKGAYSTDELRDWARWIKSQTVDVYCYLKHDELSPMLAKQLIQELGLL